MINLNKPIKLTRAAAWRTYTGGKLIEALHGNENAADSNFPEEWIMSAVCARNSGREHIVEGINGICRKKMTFAQLIEKYPVEALGEKHVKKFGNNIGVLVKLIDSAERLTVQVHPTVEKAKELFNSQFGKTECWHIIGGRDTGEKPCIYFGFKEGITREYWKELFDRQDIEKMLDCLHKFYVKEGETFLIEGGIPHAIGANCFLVEVQEPTDYTIRTEKVTPQGLEVSDFMCHQGLGFDKMFDCFTYEGFSEEETRKRWCIEPKGDSIIDYSSTEKFALDKKKINGKISIDAGGVFSGIYILNGEGALNGQKIKKGDQFFISAGCKPFEIEGILEYIRFYGPLSE